MNFWGHHGVLPQERKLGGPFKVDLEVLVAAPRRYRDRLSETVDYRVLYTRTKVLMERHRFRTLEALASAIADVAVRVPKVQKVRVKVTKLAPPLAGGATSAVEVHRP